MMPSTDRTPWIEWSRTGEAKERVSWLEDCPEGPKPQGSDEYGSIRCNTCGGHGGHQIVHKHRYVRRPEYDAPRPGSLDPKPLTDLIGETLSNYGTA